MESSTSESEDPPPHPSSPESDVSSSPFQISSSAATSFLPTASSEDSSKTSGSGFSSSSSFSSLSAVSEGSGEISAELLVAGSVVRRPLRMTSAEAGAAATTEEEKGGEKVAVAVRCVGRQERVSWGRASLIGRRKEMEDAVAVVPRLFDCTCCHVGGCTAPGSRSSGQISAVHFFGVFDGHGGSEVARLCAERMHRLIAEEWDTRTTSTAVLESHEWRQKWENAMLSGFGRTDDEVAATIRDTVGSTAVVALLSGCQIIVSNCGDSRAVLCRGTETIALSVDQKPDREDEVLRIESHPGGKIINWYGARVLGVLSMSRAIGDRYMRPYIIPVPETSFTTRTEKDECLILATDGLWEVMSNEEVGKVACRLLRRRRRSTASTTTTTASTDDQDNTNNNVSVSPAQFVADNLTQLAMARNSSDNISVVVVDLKPARRSSSTSRRDRQVTPTTTTTTTTTTTHD